VPANALAAKRDIENFQMKHCQTGRVQGKQRLPIKGSPLREAGFELPA
jgi:hypothetical protein